MRKRLFFSALVLIVVALSYEAFIPYPVAGPLTVEKQRGASGLSNYTIIYKNSAKIDFRIVRPDKKDTNVLLCIAAAFTKTDNNTIDGVYICNGKAGNTNAVNKRLGGAIKIVNGEAAIFPTEKGKLLTDSLIGSVEKQKGSLFQQIQMIENGGAATFKDSVLFQRRGIAIFKNGRTAIIESGKAITLKTFADDLVQLGVKDLLYTDMGSWDEGWYRSPENGSIVKLGFDHSQTPRQCNWVVFTK